MESEGLLLFLQSLQPRSLLDRKTVRRSHERLILRLFRLNLENLQRGRSSRGGGTLQKRGELTKVS